MADLAKVRAAHRSETIVLCHGAFDLVHMGHLLHLRGSTRLGDRLVVTITGDKHITKHRSVSLHEDARARQLAAPRSWTTCHRRRTSACCRSRRSSRTSTSRAPSTRTCCRQDVEHLSRESHRRRLRRTCMFTSGETIQLHEASHFPSHRALQGTPLLARRVMFRDVSGSTTRSKK